MPQAASQTGAQAPGGPPRALVLGVEISPVSASDATGAVIRWVRQRERHYVTLTSVHGVVEAQGDPRFKQAVNRAGLCLPDGMPLAWMCRLAGYRRLSKLPGPDFMLDVSRALGKLGGRAFYYGGAPEVADELARAMEESCPGLVTVGTYCPPFRSLSAEEEEEIAGMINRAAPDVVWVGLSTPKQEMWMARFRRLLDAPVLIGVGAAFDYNTGRLRRAPAWMQTAGLEWLYRLIQEPRRLWKRYTRSIFLFGYYLMLHSIGVRNSRTGVRSSSRVVPPG